MSAFWIIVLCFVVAVVVGTIAAMATRQKQDEVEEVEVTQSRPRPVLYDQGSEDMPPTPDTDTTSA